jgi:hypothetical protein
MVGSFPENNLRGGSGYCKLSTRYQDTHCKDRLKQSTRRQYVYLLDKCIVPEIGRIKVADVTRADIANLQHKLAKNPDRANKVMVVLSKMFNLAEVWGLRKTDRILAASS